MAARPGRRLLLRAADALVVIGVTVFVFVQLDPGLLFGPNMDVGGDNAAHVVAVSYFIHHLIDHGRLSGWDPQWWGGFPLYVFYFPLPAVIAALFNVVVPFAVAFKMVTVLGTLLMPVAAYTFGRLAGFARPVPALMAVGMLPFLFNTSYTIDGGNLASTLAGEFSFTLSVAVGLFALGCYVASLRTGRLRWLSALLFGATILCHVVPGLFFAGAALVFALATPDRRRALHVFVPVGIVSVLLVSFWLFRFGADLRYSYSMGYARVGDVAGNFLPKSVEVTVQCLAGIGLLIGLWKKHIRAFVLAVLALGSLACFIVLPSGLVYNARWLPFWFLSTALLAAYAVGEIGAFVARHFGRPAANAWLTPVLAGVLSGVVVAGCLGLLPQSVVPATAVSFVPGWVSWNESGYQAKPGWGQFEGIVAMLESVARTHGCGRLDYEYSANVQNVFGSTLTPMSFPMWTDGCIDTTEGLYYESSTTTPFHFLDQSELSMYPSNPAVGLPYESVDVPDGIAHLQLDGVRYFLANSAEIEDAADADPALVRVGSAPATADAIEASSVKSAHRPPRWVLYLVRDAPLVEGVTRQPVVEHGLSKLGLRNLAISWYEDPSEWAEPITTSGPASWRVIRAGALPDPAAATRLPSVQVSSVRTTDDTVSFTVSRTGVPVYVKVPYFPNWHAFGATGPYLATPNVMIVVPTSRHVTLAYGTAPIGWVGRVGTVLGLVGLVALRLPAPAGRTFWGGSGPVPFAIDATAPPAGDLDGELEAGAGPGGDDGSPEGTGPEGADSGGPALAASDAEEAAPEETDGSHGGPDAAGPDHAGGRRAPSPLWPAAGDGGQATEAAPELSVVLPAHNESMLLGSTVASLVDGLSERGHSYEVIIVENGSSDGTLHIARALAAQLRGVRILSLPRADYGEALAAGYRAATGEVIVSFDVDYYDFAFLDEGLELLGAGGAAIVVASKRAQGAHDARPALRRLLTAGFSGLVRAAVGLPVSDAHGMKLLVRRDVERVVEACVLRGSVFDVELVARAGRAGLSVAELPAEVVERRPARTAVLGRSVEALLGVVRLRVVLRREERAGG